VRSSSSFANSKRRAFEKSEEYPGEQDHVLDCPGKVKNDTERNRNEYFTFAILNGRFVEVPEIRVKSRIIPKNV
jgi:hypothetical protein